VQRQAASVGQYSELLYVERGSALEDLDGLIDVIGGQPLGGELVPVLVLGLEVTPRTQPDDCHEPMIAVPQRLRRRGS